jgi:hypothetical protein
MTDGKQVWVVQDLFQDTPCLLSIHENIEDAFKARDEYVKRDGDISDYRITGWILQ